MEQNFEHNLEAEIAELSREIEVKRRQLEAERGVVTEREVVHEVVADKILSAPTSSGTEKVVQAVPITASVPTKQVSDDYLAGLDEEVVASVNAFISSIPVKGIKKTIEDAKLSDPLTLDAFHDALVTKLYAELQARGIVQ